MTFQNEKFVPTVNSIIEQNLDYYINLKTSPGYALFINGPWGAGKTFLIKNYLKEKEIKDYIHISLYGLSTQEEIEDQFFKSRHPFMSNKALASLGHLGKATIKFWGWNVNSWVDDIEIKLKEFLPDVKNKLLIFDDLERCLAIPEALGFINRFIEHYDNRVIILGDETKIEIELFKNQKEKTIGRTFTITPAFETTFDSLINQSENDAVKSTLIDNFTIIRSCFDRNNCQNLRTLKFCIMEFARFFRQLPSEAKVHNEFLSVTINTFFSICLEIRSGNLTINQISELPSAYSLGSSWGDKKDAENANPLNKIRERHFGDKFTIEPNLNLIEAFFKFGIVEEKLMTETINNSSFFYKDTSPSWLKLWHSYSLTEEDFKKNLDSTLKDFQEYKYLEVGELRHIVGILLDYSGKGLIPNLDKDGAVNLCSNVLNHISESKLIKTPSEEKNIEPTFDDSSYGLQYHSLKDYVFDDFSTQIKNMAKKKRDEGYKELVKNIPEVMKKDPSELWSILTSGRNNWEKYPPLYRYAVLQHIDIDEFLKALIEMNPAHTARFTVMAVLKDRYQHHLSAELVKDIPWLKSLQKKMEEKIPSMGQPTKYQFEALKGNLDNIIKDAEEWSKQLQLSNQSQPSGENE